MNWCAVNIFWIPSFTSYITSTKKYELTKGNIYGQHLRQNTKNEKKDTNKLLALKYCEFIMIDDKPIMNQVHELQIMASN